MTTTELDLRATDVQPAQRLVATLLFLAILDRAEHMEISLEDISSETGLRIKVSILGISHEYAPASGHLFGSLVVVLCNYAEVDYYSKGRTEGTIVTKSPRSEWRLQSDDLTRGVLLTRLSPIRECRPIDWGT